MQLVTDYFIKVPASTTRTELISGIKTNIISSGHDLRKDSQIIIKAIIEENKRALVEKEEQRVEIKQLTDSQEMHDKQVESLTATIDELRNRSHFDSEYEEALDAARLGDVSVAESLFQKQIDESSQAMERSYINLGALNVFIDPEKAIHSYNKAAELNSENHDNWIQLGILLLRTGSADEAMSAFKKVLAISSDAEDLEIKLKAMGYMGNVHLQTGRLPHAEQSFLDILALAEELDDYLYLAQAHGSLAKLYFWKGKSDDALKHVDKALELFPKDNEFGIANQYSLKGLLYLETDLNKSERLIRESLRMFRKIEAPEYIAYQLGNLGVIHRRRGKREYPDALKMHKEALLITEKIGQRSSSATSNMNIGVIYSLINEKEKGRDHYCIALSEFLELGNYARAVEVLVNLGGYHRNVGEIDKALDLYKYALRLSILCKLGGWIERIKQFIASCADV